MSSAIGVLVGLALLLGVLALGGAVEQALGRLHTQLMSRALEQLPAELRARYAEEWRADLVVLAGRPAAATIWALGLRRASIELCRQAGVERPARRWLPSMRAALPLVGLDAVSLGLAYYAGYALRFGRDVPQAYSELFERTLPFAVVGGLLCLTVVGGYGARSGAAKVSKGVGLATLAIVAYVALLQPILISSAHGFVALNVPGGVCAIFALSAGTLMVLGRAGIARAS
jgi:hypothetical protein